MSTGFARKLRRDSTEAEKRVWRLISGRRTGAKFRRQQPIQGYIVDFLCFEHRLVIEIDGGQHADPDAYEERRTRCLEANGFHILRLWNNDVMENEEGVFERIMEALRPVVAAPSPSHAFGAGPSLSREGRGEDNPGRT
jgi:crossover junction endodeoxyribonuclease RuvC